MQWHSDISLTSNHSDLIYQVRDELEHLLDDDDDMAEMYLTDKLEEQLEASSVSSVDEQDGEDEAHMDDRHMTPISFYRYLNVS